MPRFSMRNSYFIFVVCLMLLVIGVTSWAWMRVDLFSPINLPEVAVATFYSGMPPQDIETNISDLLERFFTLAGCVPAGLRISTAILSRNPGSKRHHVWSV